MTDEPTYYPDDRYAALVATLVRIAPMAPSLKLEVSPWTGTVTDNEVKIMLGERFDVWPEAILPFVESTFPVPKLLGERTSLRNA